MKSRVTGGLAVAMAGVLSLSMSGCSDMLEKNPQGTLNPAVLTTKSTLDKQVIAAYAGLNGHNGTGDWSSSPDNMYYGDMGAGIMHKGSTTGDQNGMLLMEQYKPETNLGVLNNKWRVMYNGVERCNDVLRILNANDIENLTEAEANQVVAEMRFLRGYYHFEAKQLWGTVPYLDETVEDPMRRVANDRDIWPGIEADFAFAMNNLPDSQAEPGRPTRYAAEAFLAKVYLFQQKYGEAKPLLDDVIASGKYQLHRNFYDNFNPEQNNGVESVFQVQTAVNLAGTDLARANRGGDLAYPNAPDEPNLSGAGFNQPTFDMVNSYKTDENGLPLIDSYYETDFKNDQGVYSQGYLPADPNPGDTDLFEPDMTTPVDPRLDWTVGRRGVPFHDWGVHPGMRWIRDQPSAGPYNQKKWIILKSQLAKYSNKNTAKFNALNINIIRYAQVLLWAAECEVEVGDLDKARAYVNQIRARARDGIYVRLGEAAPFGDGPAAANYVVDEYKESWAGQSKEWARERVRFETRLELALEGMAFFDLVRWGIAEEYLNAYIARESEKIEYLRGAVFDVNDRYRPIPLTQIDNSYIEGVPTLVQNPGY
ncbi:MAG: RagB/SusD family nutrient uptake outer membrane protein [Alistipes sp.]|nr:RagB/SusD family nutrient uptake outer membrane protein [Alistipes sp.]